MTGSCLFARKGILWEEVRMLVPLIPFAPPPQIPLSLSLHSVRSYNPKKMSGTLPIRRPLSGRTFRVRNHRNGAFIHRIATTYTDPRVAPRGVLSSLIHAQRSAGQSRWPNLTWVMYYTSCFNIFARSLWGSHAAHFTDERTEAQRG